MYVIFYEGSAIIQYINTNIVPTTPAFKIGTLSFLINSLKVNIAYSFANTLYDLNNIRYWRFYSGGTSATSDLMLGIEGTTTISKTPNIYTKTVVLLKH